MWTDTCESCYTITRYNDMDDYRGVRVCGSCYDIMSASEFTEEEDEPEPKPKRKSKNSNTEPEES